MNLMKGIRLKVLDIRKSLPNVHGIEKLNFRLLK